MAGYGVEAKRATLPGEKPKKAAKVLDHLRVKEAENGGHIVEHHFTSYEHEPEPHVFGEGQGNEMLQHVAKHMKVQHTLSEGSDGERMEEEEE